MRGRMELLLLAICFGFLAVANMANAILVGGVLLPHGDFALDPTFFANGTIERTVANEVAEGAHRAGRWLTELQQKQAEPMIVLVTTPHGIKLDYDYGIYVASRGSGTATIGGDCTGFADVESRIRKRPCRDCQHKPYNVTLDIALAPTTLSNDLLKTLHDKRYPVSGIYSYNDEAPIPLNWGEIVPLLLLGDTSNLLPLIWTFPYRRYDHAVEMVPQLLEMGNAIAEWATRRPERIAVLISGDLSHTHLANGPYGYSNTSAPFDKAIGKWAADACGWEAAKALLERATELQPDAKSCGFTGYILWHGMMCSSSERNNRSIQFDSKVIVNRNVTYYGMIAATFEAPLASDDDNADGGDKRIDFDIIESTVSSNK